MRSRCFRNPHHKIITKFSYSRTTNSVRQNSVEGRWRRFIASVAQGAYRTTGRATCSRKTEGGGEFTPGPGVWTGTGVSRQEGHPLLVLHWAGGGFGSGVAHRGPRRPQSLRPSRPTTTSVAVVKEVATPRAFAVTVAEAENSGGGGFFFFCNGNAGNGHLDQARGHRVSSVTVDGTVLSGGAGADFTLTTTSWTLRSLKGTAVTVDVTSATKYKQPGVSSPSVTAGDFVTVTGTETSTAGADHRQVRPHTRRAAHGLCRDRRGGRKLYADHDQHHHDLGRKARQKRSMSTSGGPRPSTRKRE